MGVFPRRECFLRYTSLIQKLAFAFFAVLILLAPGCGAGSADQQAHDDIAKARVAAAKGEEGSGEAIQLLQGAAGQADLTDFVAAQTKAALGEAQYAAAIDTLRRVDENEVQIARLTLDI